MEKDFNIITFEYQKTNKTSLLFKLLSVVLIMIFLFNSLHELIDVFKREYTPGWCCMLPCPSPYSGYFFI
ncbi:hypothetical protein TSEDIMI_10319 [Tenacibaculum sediminilitoris]